MKKWVLNIIFLGCCLAAWAQELQDEEGNTLVRFLGKSLHSLSDQVLVTDQLEGTSDLFFAELISYDLFGNMPKETLVGLDNDRVSRFQINLDFYASETRESYQVLMKLVERFSKDFGKPVIGWYNNLMEFSWEGQDKDLKISQIEINELNLVVIRVDLAST